MSRTPQRSVFAALELSQDEKIKNKREREFQKKDAHCLDLWHRWTEESMEKAGRTEKRNKREICDWHSLCASSIYKDR